MATLYKEKKATKLALAKIFHQLDYEQSLVENAKAKLAALEGKKRALVVVVDTLRCVSFEGKVVLANTEKNLDHVQHWIDLPTKVLGTFSGMRGSSKLEEMDLNYKSCIIEEEWTASTLLQGL